MKKRKLNFIDYFIIFIVISIVGVLGLKFRNASIKPSANNIEVNNKRDVVLVIKGVRQYSVDALRIGDKIYSDDTNNYFGKIKDIQVTEDYEPVIKNNGEAVLTRNPEKFEIRITAECNIMERANGYFAEGITEVKVNSTGKYKTIGSLFTAVTDSIEE